MANPTISVSLDHPSYAVGATMTATVTYGDTDRKTGAVTFTDTDGSGNAVSGFANYVIDPQTLAYTDSLGKVWVKQSDSGTISVWTSTA